MREPVNIRAIKDCWRTPRSLLRSVQLTIRPAKSAQKHDPYAPGLHHLCFQVETMTDVDFCFEKLKSVGIEVSQLNGIPNIILSITQHFEDQRIRLEIVAKTSARQALSRDGTN